MTFLSELDLWRFKIYFYVMNDGIDSLGGVKLAIRKMKKYLGNFAGHGKIKANNTNIDIKRDIKGEQNFGIFVYF